MKKSILVILLIVIAFASGIAFSYVSASLTLNSSSITSDTTLNLTGLGSSTIDIGSGTLSLQTTNNGPITAGTGVFTIPNLKDANGNKYSTSTPSSLAGAYLGVSGSQLTVSSTLASSSATFNFYNATTTAPYNLASIYTATKKILTSVDCLDYVGTTTFELYYETSVATTSYQSGTVVLGSIACGTGGNTVTSFTTSTLPAGSYLFADVTSTIGTPTFTKVDVQGVKE